MQTTTSRGSGRGRGGVPVLPEGMWDLLQGNIPTDKRSNAPSSVVAPVGAAYDNEIDEQAQRDALEDNQDRNSQQLSMPSGFGREKRLKATAAAVAGGRVTIERDMKGKDWECLSCFNLNWSWRGTCNKCGATKLVNSLAADNEVRDGAGRGFNERQDRISAATVEIDEEGFDDFGRRVKKLSRTDRRAKEEAALLRLSEKYKHLLPGSTLLEGGVLSDDLSDGIQINAEKPSDYKTDRNRDKSRDREDRDIGRDGKDRSRDRGDKVKGKEDRDRVRDRDDRDRGRDREDRDRGRDREDRDRGRDRDDRDRRERGSRGDRSRDIVERSRSRDRQRRNRP